MYTFLGVVLIITAVALFVTAGRKPAAGEAQADPEAHKRRYRLGALLSLIAGVVLLAIPTIALANMRPVNLTHGDDWLYNDPASPTSAIHRDGDALVVDLESGSNRYGVIATDWEANRFRASWDITFSKLDLPGDPITLKVGKREVHARRRALDSASLTFGLMDQNVANIDDRDHVSGSGIEACFSDDVRLRAADANFVVRSSSHDESGKAEIDPDFHPTKPVRVELGKRYHCELAYDGPSRTADLTVRDESGAEIVRRHLEQLKDFTNSVAWFGVSIRGYNKFDKLRDPKKDRTGYTRPRAVARIENIRYEQPA